MRDDGLTPRWYFILLALAAGPRHGLAIAREVERLSDERVHLWPAALYGAIEALTDRGWVDEVADADRPADASGRNRYFTLTRSGRMALEAETARLGDLVRLARAAVRRRT